MTDEQITRCFGKYRSCAQDCRLKSVCFDKFRELEEERRRRRYRETEYIDGMDAAGGHVSPAFRSGNDAPEDPEEIISAIEQLDVSDQCRDALLRIAQKKDDREKLETDMLAMLRKLGEIYVCDPVGFEIMFFQILAGGNQAALARKRGCTKQNINKIVAKGKKRLEAYRQMTARNPECRLTPREMAVFHAVELDGLTYRQAADVIGCSTTTIFNIEQKMRSKGIKLNKKRTGRRKAAKKATAGRGRGGNASQ